ncbi:helix-turn-helix transcriptional regulator [Streptomyces sp. NBC_01795]|uniref:helix-turn-helix transcriptional regulator n=1 Tax=Streptomyces sp. NBC_01795 TaxID=2975943 RepID=UPI002DD7F01D|nr:helix-turn-helix transcriptional regulator [Streptomyces sp. NBC_01795]WSA94119.1 helix-turn-helix transcriptional regulator [Streptomyces sp. NBC_01795]
MGTAAERRKELGDFLRATRARLSPTAVGLPPAGPRRRGGLRREDVAALSQVSATWYTWLEQGRDIQPSRHVLDALARTLRLSGTEHAYVLSLAGYVSLTEPAEPAARTAPGHVQRLLDALVGFPAYAIARDWTITGWNAAYLDLYPNVATVAPEDRNLLWLVFTDPYVRDLLPDWEVTSRRFLAEFRAEAGPRLGDLAGSPAIQRLLGASEGFREAWQDHHIEGFTSRMRVFDHPVAGVQHFEHHRLAPADHPDLHVVVYTPAPANDDETPATHTSPPAPSRLRPELH